MRLGLVNGGSDICERARSSGRGLQSRMPLTLPLPPAVACADALEQVPPIILLAPRVANSVGCPGVLVIASVSRSTGDTSTAFSQTGTIHHHPALIWLFPSFSNNVGSSSSMIKTFLSYRLAGPFSFPITKAHTLQHVTAGLMWSPPRVTDLVGLTPFMATVCNGTTYPPSPSSDAGTVPDHGVFRALISVTHSVSVPSVLVKASLFRFRFTLAIKSSAPSITGTNQGISQVGALPLLVYLIVFPIVITARLALADSHWGLGLNDLLSLPLALRGSGGGHRCPQGQDGQQQQPGPRTPEHLETVREGDALTRRQVATKFVSLCNLREKVPVPSVGW